MNNIDCIGCHQLGQEATRTIPAQFGKFKSGAEAWMRRISSGQSGEMMTNRIAGQFGGAPYKYFGDWTDRVAKGELPKNKPPRPTGVERNLVVTTWDWSTPDKYLHDLISSDRRNPTVNANGPLYGSPEYATDNMPILDPKTNTVSFFKMPVADPGMPVSLGPGHAGAVKPTAPSAYWGDEILWDTKANKHNAMFDGKGRVWLAATVRGMDNPAWCKKGSEQPVRQGVPDREEPAPGGGARSEDQGVQVHRHLLRHPSSAVRLRRRQHAVDVAAPARWPAGSTPRCSTRPATRRRRSGWFPFVLDTNGNGKLDEFGDKPEEGKDTRFNPGSGPYAVMPHPTDGSIWYTSGVFGGTRRASCASIRRPSSASSTQLPKEAIGLRGGDIGKDGVLYGSGSAGHLIAFDRRKCKAPLNGPNATGNHCPEGFTLTKYPGPGFDDVPNSSAEASYYTWVDHHNAVGLGDNIPISTANLQDGFVALVNGKMILMRVPYPMGYYAKGLDARIDDPNAGWKGRGLWSASGDRTPWLNELRQGRASDGRAHPGAARSAGALSGRGD